MIQHVQNSKITLHWAVWLKIIQIQISWPKDPCKNAKLTLNTHWVGRTLITPTGTGISPFPSPQPSNSTASQPHALTLSGIFSRRWSAPKFLKPDILYKHIDAHISPETTIIFTKLKKKKTPMTEVDLSKKVADRYLKREVLGEGTYGVVYKAIDTKVKPM